MTVVNTGTEVIWPSDFRSPIRIEVIGWVVVDGTLHGKEHNGELPVGEIYQNSCDIDGLMLDRGDYVQVVFRVARTTRELKPPRYPGTVDAVIIGQTGPPRLRRHIRPRTNLDVAWGKRDLSVDRSPGIFDEFGRVRYDIDDVEDQ